MLAFSLAAALPSRRRVLLYSAHEWLRAHLAEHFRAADWSVIAVPDGPAAFDAVACSTYELVLVDLRPFGPERAVDFSILLHLHVSVVDARIVVLTAGGQEKVLAKLEVLRELEFLDRETPPRRLLEQIAGVPREDAGNDEAPRGGDALPTRQPLM